MAEQPDLILLGGDYVTSRDRRYVHPAADALARAVGAARRDRRPRQSRRRSRDAGGADGEGLHGAARRAHAADDPRRNDGLRRDPFWTYKVADIAHVLRGAVPQTFLLAHTPKRLLEAQQLAVPAVISGHTHGGQIVLPGSARSRRASFP